MRQRNKIPLFMRLNQESYQLGNGKMNNLYDHMNRDVETDLVAYIMGLWHMDKMSKQAQNYNGAIKLKGTTK